jgi:hypothetical protein
MGVITNVRDRGSHPFARARLRVLERVGASPGALLPDRAVRRPG